MSFLLSKASGLSEWPFIWPFVFIFIFSVVSKHSCIYDHLIYKGNTGVSLKLLVSASWEHSSASARQGGDIGMYLLMKHVFNPDSCHCPYSNYFSQMNLLAKHSFIFFCSGCFSITNSLSHIKHPFQRRMTICFLPA